MFYDENESDCFLLDQNKSQYYDFNINNLSKDLHKKAIRMWWSTYYQVELTDEMADWEDDKFGWDSTPYQLEERDGQLFEIQESTESEVIDKLNEIFNLNAETQPVMVINFSDFTSFVAPYRGADQKQTMLLQYREIKYSHQTEKVQEHFINRGGW